MDLYEVESKIKELEASYNKEADNLMQELNAYKKKNPILPMCQQPRLNRLAGYRRGLRGNP